MTREEFREQLATFISNVPEEKDYVRADMILALFAQYDPFREVLEFVALASSAPGGAKITTHWVHQTLIRGGLSETDRSFRDKLITHPPFPRKDSQLKPNIDISDEKQVTDRALQICRGCAFIDQDCLPDGEDSCSKRKEKSSGGSKGDES